jgi:hypothetical protein
MVTERVNTAFGLVTGGGFALNGTTMMPMLLK